VSVFQKNSWLLQTSHKTVHWLLSAKHGTATQLPPAEEFIPLCLTVERSAML